MDVEVKTLITLEELQFFEVLCESVFCEVVNAFVDNTDFRQVIVDQVGLQHCSCSGGQKAITVHLYMNNPSYLNKYMYL